MCYILPNIYDTKKGTAWQALFRDFLCKFSRFFRAFCPFLQHSFTGCQIMKLPASVRPPAALIRASLPLFSILWYSFLPMVVPSSPDARSRHISNGNPRQPAGSPTHGCRTGAAFRVLQYLQPRIPFPLSPVTTLYSARVPQHLPDAVADNQIRLTIARGR